MKVFWLAFLTLLTISLPVVAANPDFAVELFSRRKITALTLQATGLPAEICDEKVDGPCVLLAAGKKTTCFADRSISCRLDSGDRTFTLLSVAAPAPFRIFPVLAGKNSQALLITNAHIALTNGALQVITRIDLESYVSGVLRGEASVLAAPAARQAMAMLARTWAWRWQGRHRENGFDFCSLTHCQVFQPSPGENQVAMGLDPAALATRGRVLQYHGLLADPYFGACCGGRTEAAGNVWPDRVQPYLISLRDPYCRADIHSSWTTTLSSESLRQVLREVLALPQGAPLGELSVNQRDSSGRALTLRIVADKIWTLDANQFRYAVDRRLGWQQIKSNLYTIGRQGDSWTFTGHGLGHGVGLCQAGAEQMARLGASAEYILRTYFPGTETGFAPREDPDPIANSEHFELIYPASQEPWARQTLNILEQWRSKLRPHSEILPPRLRVTTWATPGEFIRSTGEPGWMAAASDGQAIALQPLTLLARKQILNQTLRHELTHIVVHRRSAKGVPRWFEEGCVLYLTGERIEAPSSAIKSTKELEDAITKPRSETEMKAAYAQALARVQRIAQLEGGTALWRLLEHPNDLPSNAPSAAPPGTPRF